MKWSEIYFYNYITDYNNLFFVLFGFFLAKLKKKLIHFFSFENLNTKEYKFLSLYNMSIFLFKKIDKRHDNIFF